MKILIAPDSFKGGMTAKEAATAIAAGVRPIFPVADLVTVPMADGGEGTVQSLVDATAGQFITVTVSGPLRTPVRAQYGLLGDGQTAVIEMAAASGLQYVDETTHNPLVTTTFGTGELILAALDQGVKRIILGIGGSATNDGGAGMAQALGASLLTKSGQSISVGGGGLADLDRIDTSTVDARLKTVELLIASDVTNPLVGPDGASAVFGPQKGATPEMVKILDRNLRHYAAVIHRDLGQSLADRPGAGAAGGLGAGLLAFTNATMEKGVEIVLEYTGLREKAKGVDLVFTGEGGIDFQTQFGKTPFGVAQATKEVAPDAPVVVLAGNVGDGVAALYRPDAIDAIFSILPGVSDLKTAIENGPENLRQTAENVARLYQSIELKSRR